MTSQLGRLTCLAVTLAGVGCKKPESVPPAATQPPPPIAAAQAAAEGTLFVSNEDSNDLSVIDLATHEVVATVPVGKRPRGLRVSPDGTKLLVAVSGSPKSPPGVDESTLPPADKSADGIAIVDIATRRLLRTIAAGSDPESFDLSPDGRQLYVSNEDIARASLVDLASGTVLARLEVGGEPEGVTTRPDGAAVYVTSEEDHRVDVIDPRARRVVAAIATGKRPRSVVFAADGATAWVSNENDASITVVDARRHRPVSKIALPSPSARPMGTALSPDGARLYVTLGRGRGVAVIDTATNALIKVIEDVGVRPWGVAVSPDGRFLYTANGPSHDVSVVDTATHAVVRKIPVGKSPWGLAVLP